jgi:serine/threonine protein kinase
VINEGLTHLSTTAMGTVSHQAPELMRSGQLSKQADVFSFGVISKYHIERPARHRNLCIIAEDYQS